MDICDQAATADLVAAVRPDAILHIAAIANIDYSGRTRPRRAINTESTRRLAALGASRGRGSCSAPRTTCLTGRASTAKTRP